jgi:hypothetical protein
MFEMALTKFSLLENFALVLLILILCCAIYLLMAAYSVPLGLLKCLTVDIMLRRQLLYLQRRWHSSCNLDKEGECTSPLHRTLLPHLSMSRSQKGMLRCKRLAATAAAATSDCRLARNSQGFIWLLCSAEPDKFVPTVYCYISVY